MPPVIPNVLGGFTKKTTYFCCPWVSCSKKFKGDRQCCDLIKCTVIKKSKTKSIHLRKQAQALHPPPNEKVTYHTPLQTDIMQGFLHFK